MQSIGINFEILIVQVVNFFILFLLLRWILYRPIVKLLNDRKKRIEESIAFAQKTQKESEELNKKNQEELNKTKKEALVILENAKKQSENTKKELVEEAKKEADLLMKKAETRILEQKLETKKELNNETVKLTISIVKKLLGKNIDPKTEENLIKNAMEELKR